MRKKILLAFIVWTVCTAAARAQSGPDNDADTAPGYVNSVFHHGQVDSINLYNGQLTIPISLGPSYPVGPKLKFQAVLTYNSRKIDYGHPTIQPPDYVYQPFVGNPALGQGWEFTLGAIKLCKQGSTGGFCYFGPDGSQHMFNRGSKTGDGSQLYLSGSGPYDMWDGDGNHYVFGWQVSGFDDSQVAGIHPRLRDGPRRLVPDLGDGSVRKLLLGRLLHGDPALLELREPDGRLHTDARDDLPGEPGADLDTSGCQSSDRDGPDSSQDSGSDVEHDQRLHLSGRGRSFGGLVADLRAGLGQLSRMLVEFDQHAGAGSANHGSPASLGAFGFAFLPVLQLLSLHDDAADRREHRLHVRAVHLLPRPRRRGGAQLPGNDAPERPVCRDVLPGCLWSFGAGTEPATAGFGHQRDVLVGQRRAVGGHGQRGPSQDRDDSRRGNGHDGLYPVQLSVRRRGFDQRQAGRADVDRRALSLRRGQPAPGQSGPLSQFASVRRDLRDALHRARRSGRGGSGGARLRRRPQHRRRASARAHPPAAARGAISPSVRPRRCG